jgi:ATP-dependent DNA helicase PIF1
MTVKAQGQTISHFGVYLPNSVFSPGQLYVALSRATTRSNVKILAAGEMVPSKNLNETYTKNIVYKEVFTS